ncbi:hypothetical protein D3C72_2269490 [compost metagenome]
MAVSRYRSGVGNYLQVLSAEGQVLQQKQLLIDLETQQRTLHLELIRALGGGYETAAAPANDTGTAKTPATRSAS